MGGKSSTSMRASGIVGLVLSRETTTDNSWLPAGPVWLKAAVNKDSAAACKLLGVHANAVEVVRDWPAAAVAPLRPGAVHLGDAGQQLLRRRIATPQGDYAATIGAVSRLVMAVETELGQRGSLGIGIPGAESLASGLIKNANSTCLIGRPLRADSICASARSVYQ